MRTKFSTTSFRIGKWRRSVRSFSPTPAMQTRSVAHAVQHFGALVMAMLIAGAAFGQSAGDPATPSVPTIISPSPSTAPAITSPPSATGCEENLKQLAPLVVQLRSTLDQERQAYQELQEELRLCQGEVKLHQSTNTYINEELHRCQENPPQSQDFLLAQQELTGLRAKLAEAEATIESLSQRLDSLGYSSMPGFAYLGSNYDSFVDLGGLAPRLGGRSRLEEAKCADAMAWLSSQQGDLRAIRLTLWVWRESQPLLCLRAENGGTSVVEPTQNDEGHIVVFQ